MSSISTLVSSIMGNESQRSSANKAADAAKETAQQQTALIRELSNQARADMAPFLEYGATNVNKLAAYDVSKGLDSFVSDVKGLDQYEKQMADLKFEFDESDPVYKWRQQETERQVNQFQASRGSYDSRAALNALTSANMNLQSDEIDRQYQQNYLSKYQQIKDSYSMAYQNATTGYNMQSGKNQLEYNKLLDAVKIGTGQASAAGNISTGAAGQISNVLGAASNATQNALLTTGATQASNWSNYGKSSQSTANALLSYFMSK